MCIGFEEGIKEGESPFHKRGNGKKGKERKPVSQTGELEEGEEENLEK